MYSYLSLGNSDTTADTDRSVIVGWLSREISAVMAETGSKWVSGHSIKIISWNDIV